MTYKRTVKHTIHLTGEMLRDMLESYYGLAQPIDSSAQLSVYRPSDSYWTAVDMSKGIQVSWTTEEIPEMPDPDKD